jgi:hypothetical protein
MWFYQNKELSEEQTEGYVGFVYLITNLQSGRKYIGKKLFTKAGYKTVKGKKKKIRKVSDWASYYGSNEELKNEVKLFGESLFRREILHLCKSKAECSYKETFEIFNRECLLSNDYYNSWVSARIHKSHVINRF